MCPKLGDCKIKQFESDGFTHSNVPIQSHKKAIVNLNGLQLTNW